MKTKLTEKEEKALKVMLEMSNLEDDNSAVWTQPRDLIQRGYSRHEAAGLFSSLSEKFVIDLTEERTKAEGGDLYEITYDYLPKWKQAWIDSER